MRILSVFIILFLLAGCKVEEKPVSLNPEYGNILNIKSRPEKVREYLGVFSDLGAWHGLGLLPDDEKEVYGGFAGPIFMSGNLTLGTYTDAIGLEVDGKSWMMDEEKIERTYYPGRLVQRFKLGEIDFVQEVVFADNRNAIVRSRVTNTGATKQVKLAYKGNFFSSAYEAQQEGENGLCFSMPKRGIRFDMTGDKSLKANLTDSLYSFVTEEVTLENGKTHENVLVYSASFTEEGNKVLNEAFNEPEKYFAASQARWDNYINKLMEKGSPLFVDLKYRRIALKCMMTMMANWRSPAQDILHDGGYPSYIGFSSGFWSWDSWKIAAGLAGFAPELAKDHIRALFDYQMEDGMIPDFVSRKKEYNNLRDTKPPLASWAVACIFDADGDRKFVEEMYDKLVKYHNWWYSHRDHDQNGICEYGSTDGTLVAAAWESGMDNAVRFDSTQMLQNDAPKAWSTDQESVDLNSYLYDEKLTLARFARLLDKGEDAAKFEKDAAGIADYIRNTMYDANTGFFFDVRLDSHQPIPGYGPEGWLPLWAHVADTTQAATVRKIMMDEKHFNSYVPLGTLDVSHEKLNPVKGYWRGPVWLDQTYFGLKGLRNYGYREDAQVLTLKVLDNCQGLAGDMPVHENYNPLTGEVLNAPHFGWSSAHLLLMMYEY